MRENLQRIFILFLSITSQAVHGQWDMVQFQSSDGFDYISRAYFSFNGKQIWAMSYLNRHCDTAIYLSQDGGYNFTRLPFSNPHCKHIRYIQPVNDTVVYLLHNDSSGFRNEITYTTDGGKTWLPKTICNNGDTAFLKAGPAGFIFYDSLRGSAWAATNNDTSYKCKEIWNTSDGGYTWHRLPCDSIKIFRNEHISPDPKGIFGPTLYSPSATSDSYLIVAYAYGHYWERRNPVNFSPQSGKVSNPAFRDSLIGIGLYNAKDPDNWNRFYGITHDGGRTWDTTLVVPFKAYQPHYVRASGSDDSGFYFLNGLWDGAYLSYDNFKTTVKFSHFHHYNFFYRDTKHLISSVSQQKYGYDLLIFKHFGYVGLEETVKANGIKAYPNPLREKLTVESPANGQITLMDVNGVRILQSSIFKGENNLDVSEIPAGFYVLLCEMAEQTETIKLIKMR